MTGAEVNLSAVEFLNTKPFIIGLNSFRFREKVSISQDTPAQCSNKLQQGQADIGIVPVADFADLRGFRKITRWGIGAHGQVDSVLLVANQPIDKLKVIKLDYQSRTSNQLMRILADDYYRCTNEFLPSTPGYEGKLDNDMGAVLIGDRALRLAKQYAYTYDLAEAWNEMTGLPFLFAIWVASGKVSQQLEGEIDIALGSAMGKRRQIAAEFQSSFPDVDIYQYLTQRIQYEITPAHETAMELFIEKIQMLESIS